MPARPALDPSGSKRKDVIIIVMGPTGAGKTSFINLVSGSELRIGVGLESSTDRIQFSKQFQLKKYNITLVDTPGFDDTTKSDVDVLMQIADYLVSSFERNEPLRGVIYLHRISDNRMGGTALRNFRMFTALCGIDALSNTAIVLNMWNEVSKQVGHGRERELKNKFFKPAVDARTRVFHHTNTTQSGRAILSYLAARQPKPLSIQKELVLEHKRIRDTTAGIVLLGDLKSKEEKHRERLREMQKEIEEAMRQGDDEDRRELEGVYRKLLDMLNGNVQEQQRIQADLPRNQRKPVDENSAPTEATGSVVKGDISPPAGGALVEPRGLDQADSSERNSRAIDSSTHGAARMISDETLVPPASMDLGRSRAVAQKSDGVSTSIRLPEFGERAPPTSGPSDPAGHLQASSGLRVAPHSFHSPLSASSSRSTNDFRAVTVSKEVNGNSSSPSDATETTPLFADAGSAVDTHLLVLDSSVFQSEDLNETLSTQFDVVQSLREKDARDLGVDTVDRVAHVPRQTHTLDGNIVSPAEAVESNFSAQGGSLSSKLATIVTPNDEVRLATPSPAVSPTNAVQSAPVTQPRQGSSRARASTDAEKTDHSPARERPNIETHTSSLSPSTYPWRETRYLTEKECKSTQQATPADGKISKRCFCIL